MPFVKKFSVYRCYPSSYEEFNFSPNEDIFVHSHIGLHTHLIPIQVVEQYNDTYNFYDFPLFNMAGIGDIHCKIGIKGLLFLILPKGKIIDQLGRSNSENQVNIYFSEDTVLYSIYNLAKIEWLSLLIKIVNDDRGVYQKIKSNPTDINFIEEEKNRICSSPKQITTQEQTDQYAFYSEGDRWFFMFDGKEARNINHIDGFIYIHALLSNPNVSITAWDLQSQLKRNIPEFSTSLQKESDNNEWTKYPIQDIGNDSKFDKQESLYKKKTIKSIYENINELEKEKKIARAEGMIDTDDYMVDKNIEIKKWKKTKSIYQSGIEKNLQREKVRQSVQKAISRCAKIIRRELPELADYLRLESKYKPTQKIQTGHTCIYSVAPSEEKSWKLY